MHAATEHRHVRAERAAQLVKQLPDLDLLIHSVEDLGSNNGMKSPAAPLDFTHTAAVCKGTSRTIDAGHSRTSERRHSGSNDVILSNSVRRYERRLLRIIWDEVEVHDEKRERQRERDQTHTFSKPAQEIRVKSARCQECLSLRRGVLSLRVCFPG